MNWKEDILGPGFEMTHVDQGQDYAGRVRCTVIRRLSEQTTNTAALYVHGFSDYFFQRDAALEFARHGFDFYAVDLRRYGRSLFDGDKMFRVKDMHEYFADIEAAIRIIKEEGDKDIILVGHSTGGLTTSLYMTEKPDPAIKALVLNSPFLTWNLPWAVIHLGIPVIKLISRFNPKFPVKGDETDRYASAVAKHLEGEWEYDTRWKPDIMPPVDAEWIRAIDDAQRRLKKGRIKVPVLFMHSTRSVKPGQPREAYHSADGVLNVVTMAKVGRKLGPDVEEVAIPNGLHDLVLSRPSVRRHVYDVIFSWLSCHGWPKS